MKKKKSVVMIQHDCHLYLKAINDINTKAFSHIQFLQKVVFFIGYIS